MRKSNSSPIRETQRVKKKEFKALLKRSEVESWRTLMGAFQKIYRTLEQELLKDNCSISRFQILLLIYFNGPMSASDIAQRLCVTRGNISTFLRRLEADKLSRSTPTGERGGRTLIELTEKGVKLFEDIFPDHIERVTKLMPQLAPVFLGTLQKIVRGE